MVDSVELAVLGERAGRLIGASIEKESYYIVNGSGNVKNCGSEEKSGSPALCRPYSFVNSLERDII